MGLVLTSATLLRDPTQHPNKCYEFTWLSFLELVFVKLVAEVRTNPESINNAYQIPLDELFPQPTTPCQIKTTQSHLFGLYNRQGSELAPFHFSPATFYKKTTNC